MERVFEFCCRSALDRQWCFSIYPQSRHGLIPPCDLLPDVDRFIIRAINKTIGARIESFVNKRHHCERMPPFALRDGIR